MSATKFNYIVQFIKEKIRNTNCLDAITPKEKLMVILRQVHIIFNKHLILCYLFEERKVVKNSDMDEMLH
jgi:hypothetical protein